MVKERPYQLSEYKVVGLLSFLYTVQKQSYFQRNQAFAQENRYPIRYGKINKETVAG